LIRAPAWLPAVAVAAVFACAKGGGDGSSASGGSTDAAQTAAAAPRIVTPGDPRCPATGEWAKCSVLYSLERAGVAPRLDSTAKVEEDALHGESFVVDVGRIAKLEVFLYPDSAARIADARKLDRTQFVNGTAPQTIRRERTLIENGNLVGLLTSINERQRERVSDALSAGAPQPHTPPLIKP
jgi:hypothetical protein